MINCSACDKEIAEQAPSCPNCGQPNKLAEVAEPAKQGTSTKLKIGIFLFPVLFSWFTLRKGVSNTARIVAFIWMLMWLGGTGGAGSSNPARGNNPSKSAAKISKPQAPPEKISSYQLYSAYENNEISADAKYKGKYLEISGVIDDIGKDLMDNMYITLKGSSFLGIQVFFNDEDASVVGSLSKGRSISVVCRVDGLMGNVMCNDAVVK